jgi:hypothetical protein
MRTFAARILTLVCLTASVSLTFAAGGAPPAAAQGSPFDPSGDLLRMPFDVDLPVTRTETRQEGREQWLLTFVSTGYDDTVEHYRRMYANTDELAPGWLLRGYGYDVGANAFTFTVGFQDQLYFMQVMPDAGGGAVLRMRVRGHGVGSRPYLNGVAPYRPSDLAPMPYNALQ